MFASIARLVRAASFVACVIVIASFAIFAIDETKSASGHQQSQVGGTPAARIAASQDTKGSLHKAIDEAATTITSPFEGLVSRWSSEWAARIVKLALALALYGFGLGYLARTLRVRL